MRGRQLLKKHVGRLLDLLDARRAADVDEPPFHHDPLGLLWQWVVHDKALRLGFGKVLMDGGPVLAFYLPVLAIVTAKVDCLPSNDALDGWPMCT